MPEINQFLNTAYERVWIDQIDLTPGLTLRAYCAQTSDAGPGIWIESTCPSGPLPSRVSPHGWTTENGLSVPKLPKKWKAAALESVRREAIKVSARVSKAMGKDAVPQSESGLEAAALLLVWYASKDERDRERLVDPMHCFKRMGLHAFAAGDAAWMAIGAPVKSISRPDYGVARRFVAIDEVDSFIERLESILSCMDKLGRPCFPKAYLEGAELDDWRALALAGSPALFTEVGRLESSLDKPLVGAAALGHEGTDIEGVPLGLTPGTYRAFLARERGLNVSFAILLNGFSPEIALASKGWSVVGEVNVEGGSAGFLTPAATARKHTGEVIEAVTAPLRAGVVPGGAVSSAGHGDGFYPCSVWRDSTGRVVAARFEFEQPKPETMARLLDQAGAMRANEEGAAIEAHAAAAGSRPRAPRI